MKTASFLTFLIYISLSAAAQQSTPHRLSARYVRLYTSGPDMSLNGMGLEYAYAPWKRVQAGLALTMAQGSRNQDLGDRTRLIYKQYMTAGLKVDFVALRLRDKIEVKAGVGYDIAHEDMYDMEIRPVLNPQLPPAESYAFAYLLRKRWDFSGLSARTSVAVRLFPGLYAEGECVLYRFSKAYIPASLGAGLGYRW